MKYKTLEEIVDKVIDYRGKTPKKLGGDWSHSGHRALSAKNIKTREIVNLESIRYVNEDIYSKWMKEEVERGDILLTSEAPFGQVYFWDSDDKIVLSQRLFGIRLKPCVNAGYVFQYMTTDRFQNELASRATGTTVMGLRQSELLKCRIALPEIDVQDKIAKTINAFDDKIKINNKIINILDDQIKACSEEILSDDAASVELSLNDICEFVTGYSYKSSELAPSDTALATIKNFNRGGGFSVVGFKSINPSKKVKKQQYVELFDILVAHTDLTQKAEIVGNAEMIMDMGNYNVAIASMDLVKVIPKNNSFSRSVVFAILKSCSFKQHCLGYVNGTTVLHLSKNALPRFKFRITNDKNKIKQISYIVNNATQMISLCMKTNKVLRVARDELLPKLLSGEIELKN